MKINILLMLNTFLVLLTACGGSGGGAAGEDPSSVGTNPSTGLPSDINGLIVFAISDRTSTVSKGTYAINFTGGQIGTHRQLTTVTTGRHPYALDRKTITYAEPCGGSVVYNDRIKTITEKGLSSAQVVPCALDFFPLSGGNYIVAKFSPDKTKIAVQIRNGGQYDYIKVIDVQTGNEIASYKNFISPEWNSDGNRLLFSASDNNLEKGIYLVDIDTNQQPMRIDQGKINQTVSYLDVNTAGDKLIFSMTGRIWMMDISNNYTLNNLKEVISDGASLYATWSPDGKYIAYISSDATYEGQALQKITFWNVASNTPYTIDTNNIFPLTAYNYPRFAPRPYISWVK
jgi:WD40 repeat protein